MDESVMTQIEELRTLTIAALRIKYYEVFGEESRSANRGFLFRRIAYRLQARAEGDLSERARRRAPEIADDSDLRLRVSKTQFGDSASRKAEPAPHRAKRPRTHDFRARNGINAPVQQPPYRGHGAGRRLRVSIPTLWVAQCDCARGHRHALERVIVLRTGGASPWLKRSAVPSTRENQRRGTRPGVQLVTGAARSCRGLHQKPAPSRLDRGSAALR